MTMMSPERYIDQLEGKSYLELIKEREDLITYICEFEKAEMSGEMVEEARKMGYSSSQVMYQMYLKYLSALSHFMCEQYNQEYVWGDRKLRQDTAESRENKSGTTDAAKAEQGFNATLELLK